MSLRPYQQEFVDATLGALVEYDRVLGVAATGAGKTCMAGEIARRALPGGPVLFIADATELVNQAADKLGFWADTIPAVEMGDSHAQPGDMLVVATTQSIHRRLDKWPRDYFRLVIVDEAHRNTLGGMAQKVLTHFEAAQVVGITATPFRSDKQQLGRFYEFIVPVDAGLVRLIREGFLSRITIKSVPAGIDLTGVRTVAGDYREDDLGKAVEPHLARCAALLREHAAGRKVVVFLPLIETSKAFAACCRAEGLRAVHVDGMDREGLRAFRDREVDVLTNAQLVSTGVDIPHIDCVMILRPTKSLVLYSQMVGRGTRICEGKTDLLLLDPLFLSDSMDLIRPARLIAQTPEEAIEMQAVLDLRGGGGRDLLEVRSEAAESRRAKLEERLKEMSKRKARTVDAIEFMLRIGESEFAEYEPEVAWEKRGVTDRQAAALERAGFDPATFTCAGHASKVLDALSTRRAMGLATPKQVKWLTHFKHPSPYTATFEEASAFLDGRFGKQPTAA